MEKFAKDVTAFNYEVLGIELREKSLLSANEMSQTINCLKEELKEFEDANTAGDFVASVDALIDLMYFAVGGLYRMGLTPAEIGRCSEIVHEHNMRKKLGVVPRRGDGSAPDAVKSEEWIGPERLMAEALGGKL